MATIGFDTNIAYSKDAGFSLFELVLVMTLTGIMVAIVAPLITQPVTSYIDVSRRTTLVDAAESAIRRMQRDLRHALPNSIRIAGGTALEILYAVDGGRYRMGPDSSNPGADFLDFTTTDTGFDVIGVLQNFTDIVPGSDSVVVYNLTNTGISQNAYFGDNRVLVNAAGNSTTHLEISPGIQFPLSSPQQRFFVINGPITYRCNLGGEILQRYSGYAIQLVQPNPPSVTPALVTQYITACNFTYNSGSAQRAGLLTISLELSDAGEQITLLHQVHIDNIP